MKSLLILGAGGHGAVVKEVAEACGFSLSFIRYFAIGNFYAE